ncbi:NUDIX hydrolase [Ornithinibacillus contaminans]|uniref:NUDIX hydrolase n=1 Tax=Ornithinibacillus contaminans TaxID=694055 RepID=UPI00064DFA23|nr:CoA pyrophosphatase [Ornithinibacillus contaminans]
MDSRSILTKLASMEPGIMGLDSFKRSAVLIPLVEIDGETHILFEVRSMQLRRQPGDICFPGGRIEADDPTTQACAVRETAEELGISEGSIQDVIPIDYVVSDMGRIIYPFVGKIPDLDQITPSTMEVEEIFTVPLSYLQQTTPEVYRVNFKVSPEENFPFHLIVGGENYNWQMRHIEELFYLYEDRVIWGLTAKILQHFLHLIER